jgi:ABC-type phosphate transport system substrate-binding protein
MAPIMAQLLGRYRTAHPEAAPPLRWDNTGESVAAGALMFELTDLAPISRPFTAAEIAPYEHQFHGDMIKQPLVIRIGTIAGRPAGIAVNKRPDSPLPARVTTFLSFALSAQEQHALENIAGFVPLDPGAIENERQKLGGFVAALDPALPVYRTRKGLSGSIRSVGSDGMKALIDGWECRFHALQPGVVKGEAWEHLGTLNGFHALLVGQTDIAPMGRELWPEERTAWRSTFGLVPPVEIAVARGGFDTPQRTTAQAIFVNPANPIARIRIDQLAAIFGAEPRITRWGQLGLTGGWADRPIHVRMPPHSAPNAMSMQMMALHGAAWNPAGVEAPIADTARALLDDPAAIGFGGLEEGAPGLKALAVAGADGAFVPLNAETASSGRYPLTRYMFIRLAPGPVPPQIDAFLRFILSRDGQERVRYSGYFPLSAREVATQLATLDQARALAR